MAKDRSRKNARTRKANTREENKSVQDRDTLNFSFKYFDETQPEGAPEGFGVWHEKGLLSSLIDRFVQLSGLTRDEAINQGQIKTYSNFPPPNKTNFKFPNNVDDNLSWGVILGISGRPRVVGFITENTFNIVFLDSEHQFWISEKKHT